MSILINFGSNVLTAARFGTHGELESFLVAYSVPQLLGSFLLLSGLSTVLIPFYIELKRTRGEAEAWAFVKAFVIWFSVLSAALALIGYLFAPRIIAAYVPGMEPRYQELAVTLTRFLIALVPLLFFSTLMTSLLNAEGVFVGPAVCAVVASLLNLLAIWLFAKTYRAWALAGGAVASASAPLTLALLYRGIFFKHAASRWEPFHPALARGLKPLLVITALGMANQLNEMSNRYFASLLETGKIATFDYAYRIVPILLGVVCSSVARPFFTHYSEVAAFDDRALEQTEFLRGLRYLSLLFLPIVGVIFALRVPFFVFLYERGKFSHEATMAIADVFVYLSPALVFWGLAQVITNALYAMQRVRLMAVLTVIGVALNIALDYVLIRPMGLQGLALAASASAAYGALATLWALRARFGGLRIFDLSIFYAKLGLALVAGCLVARALATRFGSFAGSDNVLRGLRLCASGGAGMAVYIALLVPLGIEEAHGLLAYIRGEPQPA